MYWYSHSRKIPEEPNACQFKGVPIEDETLKLRFADAWKYLNRPDEVAVDLADKNTPPFTQRSGRFLSEVNEKTVDFDDTVKQLQYSKTAEMFEGDTTAGMFPKVPRRYATTNLINTLIDLSNPAITPHARKSKKPVTPVFTADEYNDVAKKKQLGLCFASLIKKKLGVKDISITYNWMVEGDNSTELPPILTFHNPSPTTGADRDVAIVDTGKREAFMVCSEDIILPRDAFDKSLDKENPVFPWKCGTITRSDPLEYTEFDQPTSYRRMQFTTVKNALATPPPKIDRKKIARSLRGELPEFDFSSDPDLKKLLEPEAQSVEEAFTATELGSIYAPKKVEGKRKIHIPWTFDHYTLE